MSKKVLVIGENCTDIFIYGKSRIPFHRKEQLGVHDDVFEIFETTTDPGMAGNVVKNLKHFGALVEFASNAEEFCKTRYVDTETKETVFRVDSIENFVPIEFSDAAFNEFKNFDAIIISDYNRGLVTEEIIQKACEVNENVFIETKKVLGDFCKKAKMIKLNFNEYGYVKNHCNVDDFKESLVVTLEDEGCMYKECTYPLFDDQKQNYQLIGGGDKFLAAFTLKYLDTKCFIESINHSNNVVSDSDPICFYSRLVGNDTKMCAKI